MSEGKHTHERDIAGSEQMPHPRRSFWTQAPHDWRVWVSFFFMLLAVSIYVMSDDLALLWTGQPQQQSGAPRK